MSKRDILIRVKSPHYSRAGLRPALPGEVEGDEMEIHPDAEIEIDETASPTAAAAAAARAEYLRAHRASSDSCITEAIETIELDAMPITNRSSKLTKDELPGPPLPPDPQNDASCDKKRELRVTSVEVVATSMSSIVPSA
jgi:hypothetical protein